MPPISLIWVRVVTSTISASRVVFVSGNIVEPVKCLDYVAIRGYEDELDSKLLAGILPRNLPNSPGYILNNVGNVPVMAVTGDEVERLGIRIFLQAVDVALQSQFENLAERGTSAACKSIDIFPDSINRSKDVIEVVWRTKWGPVLGFNGPNPNSVVHGPSQARREPR